MRGGIVGSGYRNCACRDCFEIAIGNDGELTVCSLCEDACCPVCACPAEGVDGQRGHNASCIDNGMSRECCVDHEEGD